jgi:hypothetical protein
MTLIFPCKSARSCVYALIAHGEELFAMFFRLAKVALIT